MPSLLNELALKELKGIVEDNPSLILIDPGHLKADESLSLRRDLHDAGAFVRVAKSRLIRRAVPEGLRPHLDGKGPVALVGAEDIAAAAKVLKRLVKEEKVVLRAGLVEGQALDAGAAKRLADLPTKHEGRAMLARALRTPYLKLAKIAKAPYRRLARALAVHREKQEEA